MKKTTENSLKFNGLLDIQKQFPTEESCREFLEKSRWNGKIFCLKCGVIGRVSKCNGGKNYFCNACRKTFSVRVGTIFEDSALPLQKWFFAIYLMTAHKKGVSSCQLARDIQVTQKTAWHMAHRIRYALRTKSFSKPLNGIVEADETYVGGKQRGGKPGRGAENKTIVVGVIQRKGNVRATTVKDTTKKTLQGFIKSNVEKGSTVITDQLYSYIGLRKNFEHRRINHSRHEYVIGITHTQNIENFWSHLKRGITGIYHFTSPQHLHRYVEEFQFRFNTREIGDTERFIATLAQCEGRLQYKELVA